MWLGFARGSAAASSYLIMQRSKSVKLKSPPALNTPDLLLNQDGDYAIIVLGNIVEVWRNAR